MSSEQAVRLDVGGDVTLVQVKHGDVALLAALPDDHSEADLDEALEDLELELEHQSRVVGKGGRKP